MAHFAGAGGLRACALASCVSAVQVRGFLLLRGGVRAVRGLACWVCVSKQKVRTNHARRFVVKHKVSG